LEALDTQLWTFAPDTFLPHVRTGHPEASHTPIVLTDKEDDVRHYELLVNLDAQRPPFFARFERLVEIVGIDEASKEPARLRYRFYKDRGYPLQTFDRK
jgi:DNA polymerase-3 subunit chi